MHGIKTGCRSARHALLQSLCGLAALKKRFPAQWKEPAIEALRSLDKNDLATLLVLPTTSTCGLDGLGRGNLIEGFSPPHSARVVAEVAITIAQTSSTQQKSLAKAADAKLIETATTFADILEEPDTSKVLAWVASIGGNFFTWLDGSDPEAEQAAGFLKGMRRL